MAKANQVQAWVVGLALLAGGEFSYAHLRHLGFWPLALMVRSAWRLAVMAATAVFPGSALWVAPLVLMLIALLVWGLAARAERRSAASTASSGGNHE